MIDFDISPYLIKQLVTQNKRLTLKRIGLFPFISSRVSYNSNYYTLHVGNLDKNGKIQIHHNKCPHLGKEVHIRDTIITITSKSQTQNLKTF